MSCGTCKYAYQHLYSLGNGIYGEQLFCQAQKEAPEVNPDDICEHYKDKFVKSNPIPLEDEPVISNERIKCCKDCEFVESKCNHYYCSLRFGNPRVNPTLDACNLFKKKKDEPVTSKEEIEMHKAPIVKQDAPRVNKKCVWLNKKGECVADELCIVTNPECDGCIYFEESKYDPVSHPDHYTAGRKFEPKDVIRDWNLNFNLGNAVKYISRAGRKNDLIEDLKKARQYLDFEIEYLEKKFGMRF